MASKEPNDPVDAVRRLLVGLPAETSAQLLRLVHESKQRARGVDAGDSNPAAALFDLARISLKGFEDLAKLSSHSFDQIADALCPPGGPIESGKPAQLRLRVTVPAGDTATAGFKVTNPLPQQVEVSFTQPKLRDACGEHFPGDVSFARAAGDQRDPYDFTLGSGKTGCFELVVSAEGSGSGRYSSEAYTVVGGRVAGRIGIEVDVRSPANWQHECIEIPIGQDGVLPVLIRNPFRHRRATVHFSPTGFTAPGGAAFPGTVTLRPPGTPLSMEIGPGESRLFEVVAHLDPNSAGQPRYEGKAYVLVDERVVLQLALTIAVKP